MRILFLVLLAIPGFVNAQINRSAKELARETTKEYVVNKVFRNDTYKPVYYGELIAWEDKNSDISWTFEHTFEITRVNKSGYQKSSPVRQTYRFLFYMDKQMKVLKAESYFHN